MFSHRHGSAGGPTIGDGVVDAIDGEAGARVVVTAEHEHPIHVGSVHDRRGMAATGIGGRVDQLFVTGLYDGRGLPQSR